MVLIFNTGDRQQIVSDLKVQVHVYRTHSITRYIPLSGKKPVISYYNFKITDKFPPDLAHSFSDEFLAV